NQSPARAGFFLVVKPENEVLKGGNNNKKPLRNWEDFDEFDTPLKGIMSHIASSSTNQFKTPRLCRGFLF
ncbi:MAG: hypothetical protein M9954_16455, partial [Cyclobacteriaceae bacterium]|nr:hypothetical protein [Cyclobacteriaceae bacterium]